MKEEKVLTGELLLIVQMNDEDIKSITKSSSLFVVAHGTSASLRSLN